jgi:hypothetical protein
MWVGVEWVQKEKAAYIQFHSSYYVFYILFKATIDYSISYIILF